MIRPAFAAEAPVSRRQPPEGPSHTASGYDTFGDHISYIFSEAGRQGSPPQGAQRSSSGAVCTLGGRDLTCGNVGGPPWGSHPQPPAQSLVVAWMDKVRRLVGIGAGRGGAWHPRLPS
jgi:hypothetical protein